MTNTKDHTRRKDDQPARPQLEWDSDKKLIDAALAHLALERAACAVIRVPGTEPQLYVAVGTAAALKKLLPDTEPAAAGDDPARAYSQYVASCRDRGVLPCSRESFDANRSARAAAPADDQVGRFDRVTPQGDGSFQHSYRGKPVAAPARADVEHDHSEGGHHD